MHAQDAQASPAVVRDAPDKAHFHLRAAQCQTHGRQRKVLERLLDTGARPMGHLLHFH